MWGSNPPASLKATKTDAAGLLASLAPAAAADIEAEEPPVFNLGDIVLVDTANADAENFGLGPLTLVDLNLLRGPPPSYPETRVRGFELLPPFRVGASPTLSLWRRQACGAFSCGLVSDSPEDPWGLYSWGDFRKDVTDTAKSVGGFLSGAAIELNPVLQLYNTAATLNALAGRTKELYRKGGASAVADAAVTDVASSLPIVNTVLNASRIVDTYEREGAFEGGRQVFRTTKAAATDVTAVYGIGKAATAPEPSMSIVPEGGWSFPTSAGPAFGQRLADGRIAGEGPGAQWTGEQTSSTFSIANSHLERAEIGELLGRQDVSVSGTTGAGAARPPRHHVFPQEFRDWFLDRGVEIDRFTLALDWGTHSAIHTMGWNEAFKSFIARESILGRPYSRREVLQFGGQMRRDYGLRDVKVQGFEDP
ncbi:MAG: DUF2380 domain-containing protein [Holophagales bacterium]|nr:DUF2380 domain-containing protein [Holophagales bacterium]